MPLASSPESLEQLTSVFVKGFLFFDLFTAPPSRVSRLLDWS